MSIHFYVDGTIGGQDGIELSDGDLSHPLVVDGMYPAAGATVFKELPPIYVRCDPGEVQYMVLVEVRGQTASKYLVLAKGGAGDEAVSVSGYGSGSGYGYGYGSGSGSGSGSRGTYSHYACIVRRLADVNVPLYLMCTASGDETNTPDTACKIYARGVQINGAS